MKSQVQETELVSSIRARFPLIWIVTREEARVEAHVIKAAITANYVPRTWDVAQGVADLSGKPEASPRDAIVDPGAMLAEIAARARGERNEGRGVWIMRDMGPWLSGNVGVITQRAMRNLARYLPTVPLDRAQVIIVISTSGDIPPELASHATVFDWPLPDREEIAEIHDSQIEKLPDTMKLTASPNGSRELAIDAAIGLSGTEAAACYARSLVQLKRIDPAAVAQEKKRVIARERVLEWYDPIPGGLSWVGGLEGLKTWLMARVSAYTLKAREYGLPAPKGIMLVGVPGCGKSLFAKAVAAALEIPLIRLDMGALRSKFVGESEGNLRKALKIIEALGRCVVWLDEVEKALQGATSGSADGGVSADALGTFLSWMQERQGEAFVIATANDVTSLPPELLRKGRFDEMFFVDLPNPTERRAVLEAALRQYKRDPDKVDIDFDRIAGKPTDGFTGSEIVSLVPEAMFAAFADNAREINTDDLLAAAQSASEGILSKMADKKIEGLRAWAKGRTRPASAKQKETQADASVQFDIAS